MALINLVIFDLDGVLLDSETLYKQVNFELFEKLGVDITPEEYHSFIGIHAEHMWGYIREKGALDTSVEELIVMEREAKYQALKLTDLTPNNGLNELLDIIKSSGKKLAIASSGLQKNVNMILTRLGVQDEFQTVISGNMVVHGKPAPDIFLKAASELNIAPGNCLVIEDSRNGTIAAKAAGMTCVGYINKGSGPQDLTGADLIISDLTDNHLLSLINP